MVRDAALRTGLRELYLRGWYDYLAMRRSGLRPWAPGNDPGAEQRALTAVPTVAAEARQNPGFAEHLDTAPVVLAVFAELAGLAAVDRDFDRYSYAGGASVYPFAWSILLAARDEGLGGVITTMAVREEAAVQDLLGAPPQLSLAAVITLGSSRAPAAPVAPRRGGILRHRRPCRRRVVRTAWSRRSGVVVHSCGFIHIWCRPGCVEQVFE